MPSTRSTVVLLTPPHHRSLAHGALSRLRVCVRVGCFKVSFLSSWTKLDLSRDRARQSPRWSATPHPHLPRFIQITAGSLDTALPGWGPGRTSLTGEWAPRGCCAGGRGSGSSPAENTAAPDTNHCRSFIQSRAPAMVLGGTKIWPRFDEISWGTK